MERTIALLRVLLNRGSTWDCCGAQGVGTLDSELLAQLQASDPTWSLSLLQSLILTSKRQGRLKQIPNGELFINLLMVKVNISNQVYATSLGIISRNCRESGVVCISGDGHYSQMAS
jgi:hypothetical protein